MNSIEIFIIIIILLLWRNTNGNINQKIKPNNSEYNKIFNFKNKNNKYNLSRKAFDELNSLISKETCNKFDSNYSSNEFRNLNEINNKCLTNDEIGIKNSLCIECNAKANMLNAIKKKQNQKIIILIQICKHLKNVMKLVRLV